MDYSMAPTCSRSLAFAFMLAYPLASAFSIPSFSISSRSHPESIHQRANMLSRRAENATTIPAAIEIGPSQYWEGNDGPWSSFPLQVGEQVQTVRVMPGTSAPSIVTIGADGCPSVYPSNCSDTRGGLFFPNQSLTWVPNSIWNLGFEKNLGLDTQADAGFDTVTLGWQGSGGPTVNHSVVYNMAAANYWLGIFGLRPDPSNFTTLNDPQPSYMQQLVNANLTPSLSYGYTAGNQYRLSKVFGSLVLGGYDQNRFDGTKNISLAMADDISRDLVVRLNSIATDAGSPSNLLPDGAINIFVDSTIGQLWLPESACTAFENAFGLTYDNSSQFYLVNSSLHTSLTEQNANVTFSLGTTAGSGSVDIVLPYGAFDLQLQFPNIMNPNTSFYFPLKRATDETQYALGRTFLQEAYIVVDYDNHNFTVAPCIWDSEKVGTSSIKSILRANETMLDDGSSSGSNTGAIAGGVVGGVAALVLIVGAILFFMRRRKQTEKKRLAELEAKSNGDDANKTSVDSGNEGKPFISAPIGGELGGDGEIHELNAPYKQQAQEMDSPFKMDPNKHGYSEMEGGGYFAPGKNGAPAEMHGSTPIFEMAGSDVHEMPAEARQADRKP